MVIGELHSIGVSVVPAEANAVPLVHADTELSAAVARKGLKMVAGRHAQVGQRSGPVEQAQSPQGDARDGCPSPAGLAVEQFLRVPVMERSDHRCPL